MAPCPGFVASLNGLTRLTRDDESHTMTAGHTQTVQPNHMGLPLPHGKLAIWLFLVTEIMFFTALIGVYMILRNGTPVASRYFHWPTPHDVHLIELLGAINTFVLICSSVTVVLAHYHMTKQQLQDGHHLHRPVAAPGRRLPGHQGLRVQRQVRATTSSRA